MTNNLYDKYGGFETVSKIVHALYEKIATSELLQPYFDHVDMQRLMGHQTKFFSSLMGGPIKYSGKQLYEVHRDLHITEEAFTEVTEFFEEVLEDFGVSEEDIARLLSMVAETKPDIVIVQT